MKISIIISTYNRSKLLEITLKNLLSLNCDNSFKYEIIIVDNNSNDNTKETVQSYISKNKRFKYLFEPKQGVSNARNTGINNAKGEILAFTDDDVKIEEDWLQNIVNFSYNQDFDALGGKVIPLYPIDTPQWIKDCNDILCGPIVCHDYGETIQTYNNLMLPFIGANMIFKHKTLDEIGGFNVLIGLGLGTMGEDSEIFRRLQKYNKKIIYNPNIIIFHPIERNRMNLKYIAQWHISQGKYLTFKNLEINNKALICIFGVPRYLFREVINLLWDMLKSLNNKRAFIKSYTELFVRFGMIFAYRSRINRIT